MIQLFFFSVFFMGLSFVDGKTVVGSGVKFGSCVVYNTPHSRNQCVGGRWRFDSNDFKLGILVFKKVKIFIEI